MIVFFFFFEKGIYNALPDIVSYLSSHKPRLADSDFRQIVQFVFGFIQTEAETVSLIEKLCHRFTSINNVEQWRDIACCLSMLNFNEKGIKKLFACAPTYKDLCHDDVIYLHFVEMIKKSKSQATQAAVEVQKIIDECYMKHHPNSSLPTGEAAVKGGKKSKKGAATAAGGKAKRKRKAGNDDDDDDMEDEESSLEEEPDEPATNNAAAAAESSAAAAATQPAEAAPKTKAAPAKKAQPKKRAPAAPKAKAVIPAARPKRAGRAVASAPVYAHHDDDDDEQDESMSFSDEE